jgi:hypothetical protein
MGLTTAKAAAQQSTTLFIVWSVYVERLIQSFEFSDERDAFR